MSILVSLSVSKSGCSRWKRGDGAMSLAARPACASLALAFAAAAGPGPLSGNGGEVYGRQKRIGATPASLGARIMIDRVGVRQAGQSPYV
jgi:hypothetical protein